ncbi:cell division protein FtsL [Volucribacter psittacicida]|uniref:Cell division protein FtsL n=1 Tax=Volucribacter psittacicida TaxID=203482 RepID=A0A4R1FVL7_9PAST|nr:cell division protein FtsL [Volucribacter psittacicida]TCJ97882.1 cell division protein FtsL [Volucribacter psittacicida]
MFNSEERYPLRHLVVEDLFSSNKLALCLLILLVVTMIATIWLTHKTRQLVSEKGELVVAHQMLETDYLNLKLEETTQGDSTRIEAIAAKLGMKPVAHNQEVLIVE